MSALKEGISALDLGSADITLQQITTFCSKIAPALATLEDDPADVAGNRARLERAITSAKALTAAARGAQGGKETAATTTDTESQFMEVSRNDSFTSLEKEIASVASGPLNLDGQKKIVKTLLASQCAAGPLFLMRKLSAMDSQHPFSLVRQLKVGDGKGTGGVIIQQLCNDALSTKGGTARPWGELISAADATKFIKGNLECVKSASGFDFWELLAPSISKQYGILAVSNASVGKTGDSRWIFLSARPLELMLTPLWDLFKLLGYSKTSTGGFYATFKNAISRTKVIGDLPPEEPRTEGVKRLHVEACTEIFLCFANGNLPPSTTQAPPRDSCGRRSGSTSTTSKSRQRSKSRASPSGRTAATRPTAARQSGKPTKAGSDNSGGSSSRGRSWGRRTRRR